MGGGGVGVSTIVLFVSSGEEVREPNVLTIIYMKWCVFFSDKRQKVFFVCVWAEVTVSILNPRK